MAGVSVGCAGDGLDGGAVRTVPLERGETARPYGWRKFVVFHADRAPALLCLHSRLKVRVKEWRHQNVRLIEEARFARFARDVEDPDAAFVAAVVGTVRDG